MALQFHICGESRNLKAVYVAPALRPLALREEESFLVSGDGEDAKPRPGTWVMEMDDDLFF